MIKIWLSARFNISFSTVSRTVITWSNFLYFTLGCSPLWPSMAQINKTMPTVFKKNFSNVSVVIDCTEIKVQTLSSQRIAKLRKHVERAIRRVKENHLFDVVIPLSVASSINQIRSVCCMLSNFKGRTFLNNSETISILTYYMYLSIYE